MPTLGPDRTIKARKEHRCDLCGLRIRKGATYVYREGVEGRDHWRMRMHPSCEAATHDWDTEERECNTDPANFRYYELYLRRGTVLNIAAEILGGGK
jgi:hypothetical protein